MFALGLIISPLVVLRNKRAAHSSVSVADEWVKGGKDGEVLAAVSQIVAYILIAYAAYRLGSGYFWGAIAGIGVKSFFDYLTGDLPFQKHKYLKKAGDSQEIVPNHEAPTEHAMMPEDLPQEVLTQYVRRNYDGAVRTVREAGMASPGAAPRRAAYKLPAVCRTTRRDGAGTRYWPGRRSQTAQDTE